MPVPSERDPVATAAALADWLVGALPEATSVAIDDLVMPESSGYSNETLVFALPRAIRPARTDAEVSAES